MFDGASRSWKFVQPRSCICESSVFHGRTRNRRDSCVHFKNGDQRTTQKCLGKPPQWSAAVAIVQTFCSLYGPWNGKRSGLEISEFCFSVSRESRFLGRQTRLLRNPVSSGRVYKNYQSRVGEQCGQKSLFIKFPLLLRGRFLSDNVSESKWVERVFKHQLLPRMARE